MNRALSRDKEANAINVTKNLFIANNEYELRNIVDYINMNYTKELSDLVIPQSMIYEKESLNRKFRKIYIINYSNFNEVVDFYFENVLDIKYTEESSGYDCIFGCSNKGVQKYSNYIKEIKNKDYFGDNTFYGHSNTIKNYSGYNKKIYLAIEHGLALGGYVANYVIKSPCPAIITFGDYRFNYIREKTLKPIFRIGPYIHYAQNLYNDNFMNFIKKYLGKTLLVFPSHSIDNVYCEYCIDEFIQHINDFSVKNNFDNVLICIYWKDIELGKHIYYEQKGFKVVSGGHGNNNYRFLNKLKTIINLSDYTISNNLGTHVGYCVYLNKSHYIYNQKISYKGANQESLKKEFNRGERFNKIYLEDRIKFMNLFDKHTMKITKSQYDLCNEYWGFDHVKSADQIKFILDFYDNIINEYIKQINKGIAVSDLNKLYYEYVELKINEIEDENYRQIMTKSIDINGEK